MAQTSNIDKKIALFDNEIKKRDFSEKTKRFLLSLSKEEKIELLNSGMIANSISASTVQNSFFLYFLLNSKISKKQRERLKKQIDRVYDFYDSLKVVDKQIFRHGILNRFKTNNPQIEYWNFKKIGGNVDNFGDVYEEINKRNRYIGMQTFVEVFGMVYNKIQRILNNSYFFRKYF